MFPEDIEDLEEIDSRILVEEVTKRGYEVDKIVSDFDSDELQQELEARGYSVFEYQDVLKHNPDNYIIEEIEKRGYTIIMIDSLESKLKFELIQSIWDRYTIGDLENIFNG